MSNLPLLGEFLILGVLLVYWARETIWVLRELKERARWKKVMRTALVLADAVQFYSKRNSLFMDPDYQVSWMKMKMAERFPEECEMEIQAALWTSVRK